MATPGDVLAAVEHVKQYTGDANAWMTGLTPQELADAVTVFGASPQRLDGIIATIHRQHPDLFDPRSGEMIVPPQTAPAGRRLSADHAPDHQEGAAADAIRHAEAALAQQNSTTAQVDLQVVTAVLNAHQQNAKGREALNALQHDIEAAVTTRSDLDTPAGARDFQRFLIGKLRDIRAVVANASLDDTSNSALMAAWTSLYNLDNLATREPGDADAHRRPTGAPAGAPPDSASESPPALVDTGPDPYLDSLPVDDSGVLPEAMPAQTPPAAPPMTPVMPTIPSFGGGGIPGGGALPGSAVPGGFPLAGPLRGSDDEPSAKDLDDALLKADDPDDEPAADRDGDERADHRDAEPTAPAAGPTTVTLPDGETVTAANPQLAAAIKAAAGGTPIADAFRQEGITIPPPGTAVIDPVDPSRLTPGDIGMLTDRHALAIGQSRALLNGQIQHISTVNGPSFLGWEHPPGPVATAAPDPTDPPAPTRPANAERTPETT
jgi:Domain of unknown function (DUF4226)